MKVTELLEAGLLGQGMSKAARAADVEQSDREYIAQRQRKEKWKAERLKGCKCPGPRERDVNPNCPIHGVAEAKTDEPLTEGFWAVTNKYRLSDDPRKDSKNGEDFLSLSGDYMRPGIKNDSPRSIKSLNALLTASKGEVTDEVLAWNGSASIRKWLKWVKENGRKVKLVAGRYVDGGYWD